MGRAEHVQSALQLGRLAAQEREPALRKSSALRSANGQHPAAARRIVRSRPRPDRGGLEPRRPLERRQAPHRMGREIYVRARKQIQEHPRSSGLAIPLFGEAARRRRKTISSPHRLRSQQEAEKSSRRPRLPHQLEPHPHHPAPRVRAALRRGARRHQRVRQAEVRSRSGDLGALPALFLQQRKDCPQSKRCLLGQPAALWREDAGAEVHHPPDLQEQRPLQRGAAARPARRVVVVHTAHLAQASQGRAKLVRQGAVFCLGRHSHALHQRDPPAFVRRPHAPRDGLCHQLSRHSGTCGFGL
jgi:hypothetical protein